MPHMEIYVTAMGNLNDNGRLKICEYSPAGKLFKPSKLSI
jgi:hypothetical protein